MISKYSFVSITSSTTAGPKTCVAALEGSRTRIIGMVISSSAAQQVTIQSSTGLVQAGPFILGAGVPVVCPPCEIGYGETAQTRGVYMQLLNAVDTALHLQYSTFVTSG